MPKNAKLSIENWITRNSWSLIRKLASTKNYHNMMPHAMQRETGTALVVQSLELMRAWIDFGDRFISNDLFLPNGVYIDFSPSYQNQVMNRLRPSIDNLKKFRVPKDYQDLQYGLKFDGSCSPEKRWPLFELAKDKVEILTDTYNPLLV